MCYAPKLRAVLHNHFHAAVFSVSCLILAIEFVGFSAWTTPASWVLGTLGLHMASTLAHDALHGSLSRHKLSNLIIGHLFAALTLTPYRLFRREHIKHHAFTNDIHRDPIWRLLSAFEYKSLNGPARSIYNASRTWLWFLAPIIYNFKLVCRYQSWTNRRDVASTLSGVAILSSYLGFLIHFHGFSALVNAWIIPMLGYGAILGFFSLCHHQAVTSGNIEPLRFSSKNMPLEKLHTTTTTLEMPALIAWIFGYTNLHLAHHLKPMVPFFDLPETDKNLCDKFRIERIAFPLSLSFVKRQLSTVVVLNTQSLQLEEVHLHHVQS